MIVYAWLVDNGLWRDVLAVVVGFVMGRFVAWRPLKRALRAHARRQERIADLLDTRTPGGLGDVVKAIDRDEQAREDGGDGGADLADGAEPPGRPHHGPAPSGHR